MPKNTATVESPGLWDWALVVVGLFLLLIGFSVAFPLPALAAILGVRSVRRASGPARRKWLIYTVTAAVLAVVMFTIWLVLTPWGPGVQSPLGTTDWTPVDQPG
ncbi:hypothetical protein ACFSSC_01655 [Corynebacterium mendelii]|uniref:Uncharacterized protein n=1 Tax=Corynebacterium mendelii TaxID=2765362 RepID=A0A939IV89_9CORY|nr:hypothetical protein [Corynebacterium mendelii]MBN9643986.1 hypothetical protein [Corynebacterium mendelii]